jgi:hypothetical protein
MTAPVLPNQQHHRPGASGPGATAGPRRDAQAQRLWWGEAAKPCAAGGKKR